MSEVQAEYEYIVVGAGAAGSIVAAKVAAAGHTVLLLEKGQPVSPSDPRIWEPTNWDSLLGDPEFEMGFVSQPQAQLNNRRMNLLQSRGTGGCQLHNAMVYVRGGALTYDHWANDLGCTGWDYASVTPHFLEVEARLGVIESEGDDFTDAVVEAARSLGFPPNKQYNAGDAYGAVHFQFTIEQLPSGRRRTTAFEKYITQAAPLPTLQLVTGAEVMHLLLQDAGDPGVMYTDAAGRTTTVRATREVILSAGAIVSPAILLRSGVGHADNLKGHDIALAQHAPQVGQNFYDDLGCGFPVIVAGFPKTPYGFAGAGIFACADDPSPSPLRFGDINLELQISTGKLGWPLSEHFSLAMVGASAMHLNSRGTVSLDPASVYGRPLVDPRWLTAPGDMERCIAALKLSQALAYEPKLRARMDWLPMPIASPEEWIRLTGTTVQHYVGSCRMGPDPEQSVVGLDLKVHGFDRLRVIDASVAPTPVTGNTAGVTMMIASKGADMVLGA